LVVKDVKVLLVRSGIVKRGQNNLNFILLIKHFQNDKKKKNVTLSVV